MVAINVSLTDELLSSMNINAINYAPTQSCFDWCLTQQVVHSNNMELSGIIFIIFAYLFIVLYEIAGEIAIIKPYRENFIYYAKLLLLVFFGYFILIIRMRLIW